MIQRVKVTCSIWQCKLLGRNGVFGLLFLSIQFTEKNTDFTFSQIYILIYNWKVFLKIRILN